MRMVPIKLTTSKALLEVKGERLIALLISQLLEVGINDITVVVGFLKEKLGVDFGEYSLFQYQYAKDYYRHAKELIEGET